MTGSNQAKIWWAISQVKEHNWQKIFEKFKHLYLTKNITAFSLQKKKKSNDSWRYNKNRKFIQISYGIAEEEHNYGYKRMNSSKLSCHSSSSDGPILARFHSSKNLSKIFTTKNPLKLISIKYHWKG